MNPQAQAATWDQDAAQACDLSTTLSFQLHENKVHLK